MIWVQVIWIWFHFVWFDLWFPITGPYHCVGFEPFLTTNCIQIIFICPMHLQDQADHKINCFSVSLSHTTRWMFYRSQSSTNLHHACHHYVRNTAVYRYRGIFVSVCCHQTFLDTAYHKSSAHKPRSRALITLYTTLFHHHTVAQKLKKKQLYKMKKKSDIVDIGQHRHTQS